MNRYILQPYSGLNSRYTCPGCGKPKQFTRYLDTETNQLLSETVGRCNREVNCGYHLTPKQFFTDHPQREDFSFAPQQQERKEVVTPVTFTPTDLFKKSIANKKAQDKNCLLIFLRNVLGEEVSNQVEDRFSIGTSNHWPGATIFWQQDISGKIRSGKVMLYDPETGKRVRDPFNHITWVHSILIKQKVITEFNLNQCLFGLHQLNGDDGKRIVGILESEKSCIIASAYIPSILWMAAGSLTNLTVEKLKPLQGRQIILFPDLGCYDKWKQKARVLTQDSDLRIVVSDFLERIATEADKQSGFDLADFLLKINFIPEVKIEQSVKFIKREPVEIDDELNKLLEFCSTVDLPESPLRLNKWSTVTDVQKFVSSHIAFINSNRNYMDLIRAFVDRLYELKELILIHDQKKQEPHYLINHEASETSKMQLHTV